MNPTANKSDFEDLTTNLKDLAYSYLEKYSPSKQQLKVYLLKKYLTKEKNFMLTYGDGLTNQNLCHLEKFHRSNKKRGAR